MSSRPPRALGWIDSEIPLRRYFLCVGGALLTLLFAADALMPRPPANESIGSGPKLPRILIHSERKGPEAVVIDTNQPAIVPPGHRAGRRGCRAAKLRPAGYAHP